MSDEASMTLLSSIDRRLSEINAQMVASDASAAESRRRTHEQLNQHANTLVAMEHRMSAVEKNLQEAKPMLDDVRDYKLRIQQSGRLGRALWKIGGVLLAGAVLLYGARHRLAEIWQVVWK